MRFLEKEEDFDNIIGKGIVIVDFYADWCGPCQLLGPVLEELGKKRQDIEILKVDTDNFINLSRKYGVMSIPTLKVFKNGKLINSSVGYLELKEIEELLK